jgi:hypothetical protein
MLLSPHLRTGEDNAYASVGKRCAFIGEAEHPESGMSNEAILSLSWLCSFPIPL